MYIIVQAEIREHLTLEHSRLDDRIYTCKCGRQFNKKGARNNHYKRFLKRNMALNKGEENKECKLFRPLNSGPK